MTFGRVVDHPQRDALNAATKRNGDVLANHPFFTGPAIASGKLRAVTHEKVDGVVCAFAAVGDDVTALRRAAGAEPRDFLGGRVGWPFGFWP